MPQQQSPFLEGKYGWNFGEGGWNTGMDENLLKFSYMFDRNVDGIVGSLPSAVNGQAYFLTTDNRLYFAVGTTWYSSPVPKWFEFKIRSTGALYQFNGNSVIEIETPVEVDARLEAVETTISSLGTAAYEDTSFFASKAELEVSEASLQNYVDNVQQNLQEQIDQTNVEVNYLYSETNKIFESSETDKKYAAFCDSTLVLGKEVYVNRVSSSHMEDGGGISSIYIFRKEDGLLQQKYIIHPIAGMDFRDPSIVWDPVSRRLVLTVQIFDVLSGTYDGGRVYVFSPSFSLLNTYTIGSPGFFQWGKALRTPAGNMLVAAYSVSNTGVNLYTSSGTFDSPGTFTLTASIFTDDVSLSRTEVSIHYWKEFLVAVARTQDIATQSLQNMSISYTRDLTGATGWVTGGRLTGFATVAPRLTTMEDGALCITGGSVANGFRGSVSAIITYDLLTFSSVNTIFSGTVGNGGYHGITQTKDGLSIYTYQDTISLTTASTYLSYLDPDVVQMLKVPTTVSLNFFSPSNVTYIGSAPFGTNPTTGGGYVTIFIRETINNCKGIVLNLGGSTGGSAQPVIIQRTNGTTFATLGAVNVTATGTYYASHAGFNIPAGSYRLTVSAAGAYVCTGVRKNTNTLTYSNDRVYGLVDVNGIPNTAGQDLFVGFAV